ncbi:3'(2'),5'-bisphosphate nucleotidase CysQ [Nocardia sp. NBC_01499]|uniref:inositol monophosphatase family protein n=1 Tax=Nocardia sp. NBC_01499 TaxID=2903597 RepID=UPI00386EC69A
MSTLLNATVEADRELLPAVVTAVRAAGAHLRERFVPRTELDNRAAVFAAITATDAESLPFLREPLLAARPGAGWVDDELAAGDLPAGEWWVADAVEGNINYIHGMTDWAVTATLVRDNQAVLTVVHLPLVDETYTAVRGGGAFRNGVALRASAKTGLDAALVGTGQAKPGEDRDTFRRIGESVTAMLEAALVIKVSVPATLQLIQVAAGRSDVFWQYSAVRSGLLPGALLVAEAGGTVTDTEGNPWQLSSPDFLASAPGLHAAARQVLATVR